MDKYANLIDNRKYLVLAFPIKDHMQLVVGTNKLRTLWICNSDYDCANTLELKEELIRAMQTYYRSLYRPYEDVKFKNIHVTGQPGTFECGYLTIINAIKDLRGIRQNKRVPTNISYEISSLVSYRKRLAEMSKIIIL